MRDEDGTTLVITATSDWWRRALGNPDLVRESASPQPGWYKRKMITGGVYVGARVWMQVWVDERGRRVSDETLVLEVNGERRDDIYDQWTWLVPCPEAECRYLLEDRAHARDFRPEDPEALPGVPVDHMTAPVPF